MASAAALLGCLVVMACAGAAVTSDAAGRTARDIEPAVCAGCEPPLTYGGGPVMATHSSAGTTVVPIYWVPAGWKSPFPPGFRSTIDRFIANVAAASGTTDNVFSVATEYYSAHSGVRADVAYKIRAGPVITDSSPFPAGCTPRPDYTACVTDGALRAELGNLIRARGLAADLDHVYAVFFPPKVETRGPDGTSSDEDFCAYHLAFKSGGRTIVYANQPFDQTNCGSGQTPNGSVDADNELGNLSHEIIEAMTDPVNTRRAWDDKAGYEIADLCAFTFGRPLGYTRRSDPTGSEYNQVINGGRYYLPQEFSNSAFERFGVDRGAFSARRPPTAPPPLRSARSAPVRRRSSSTPPRPRWPPTAPRNRPSPSSPPAPRGTAWPGITFISPSGPTGPECAAR